MHRQAHEVLPALLQALGIDAERDKPWLFGHSDGGSIALLHAARFPQRVGGAVVLAPHIVVEDLSVVEHREGSRRLPGDRPARPAREIPRRPRFARSGAGTASGCIRRSASGRSKTRSPPSPARCSPCKGSTTSTARSSRFAASRARCRKPDCWSCPIAGTVRTGTSRRRSSPPSPIFSNATLTETTHEPTTRPPRRPRRRRAARRGARPGAVVHGQAQGGPDAALHRHLRRARHGDRERLPAACAGAGRQARRARDRVREGR